MRGHLNNDVEPINFIKLGQQVKTVDFGLRLGITQLFQFFELRHFRVYGSMFSGYNPKIFNQTLGQFRVVRKFIGRIKIN